MRDDVHSIRKRNKSTRNTGKCNENKNNEGTDKKVSDDFKTSDNYNGEIITKNNKVIVDKVNENENNDSEIMGNNNNNEVVAVSYTHLDVYKRQDYNNTSDDNVCLRGKIHKNLTHTPQSHTIKPI